MLSKGKYIIKINCLTNIINIHFLFDSETCSVVLSSLVQANEFHQFKVIGLLKKKYHWSLSNGYSSHECKVRDSDMGNKWRNCKTVIIKLNGNKGNILSIPQDSLIQSL